MATTNVRYVDPNAASGGTGITNSLSGTDRAYSSLNAWEAARQADLPTGDIIERCICSSDDAGSTHAADTTAVTIDGWTTDATRYIQIEAASSHGGIWNDNIYRFHYSSATHISPGINFKEFYIRFTGLQLHCTPLTNEWTQLVMMMQGFPGAGDAGTIHISKNLFKHSTALTNGFSAFLDSDYTCPTMYIYNNIFYDVVLGNNNSLLRLGINTSGHYYIYNNDFINITGNSLPVIKSEDNDACTIVNNLFSGCNTNVDGTYSTASGSGYNSTTNASIGYNVTGGATGDRLSQTFTFVDAANKDFHLASNDAGARDYGVSDPGSGLFSDDIDGVTRTGTWDIGADEYVAGVTNTDRTPTIGAAALTGVAGRMNFGMTIPTEVDA